jgi:SAM-dependent methyltransferase
VSARSFDPSAYWRRRVTQGADLGVVGHRALGREYNAYIYRRRVEALDGFLAGVSVDPHTASVLDVGAGSGFYLDYWQQRGAKNVVGIDVSPAAASALQQRFPAYRILCADVTKPDSLDCESVEFDVITLFDVLYHITRDTDAEAALKAISSRLAPNGYLLVFDHIMRRDYSLRRHVRFRGEETYSLMLRAAQLQIIERISLFSVLEPPLYGNAALDVAISGAYRAMGTLWRVIPHFGRVAGAVAYRLDAALRMRGFRIPNHELLVMRRDPEVL